MTHIEHVQRSFADSEILDMGKDAAQLHEQIRQLEEEKKQANDHFKDEISRRETEISELSTRITHGYEIVPTPCDVFMNQPTRGMKQFICQKTMQVVKTCPMTDADQPPPLLRGED